MPATLEESLEALQADGVLKDMLTHEGVQTFIVDKQYEIEKVRQAVGDYGTQAWQSRVDQWERDEFMELI